MSVKTKPRVLLVEDDQDLVELYRLQLEQGDCQVSLAGYAQAALDELDNKPIDVIVLDILLPQVNGLSIVHQLRSYEDWHQIPVIILSNLSPRDLGITPGLLSRLGVRAYLEKSSTNAQTLVAAVREAHGELQN